MKNHGQSRKGIFGLGAQHQTRSLRAGVVSSPKPHASVSITRKYRHWSKSSRRYHSALAIYEDDASCLPRGCCTDKSLRRAWHGMERHMCDENVFHLPREEPEKDKNKPKPYFPHGVLFPFFPFLLCISVFTTSAPPFLSLLLFLPPSFSSSFQLSFLSFLLIFPFAPFI